MFLTDDAGETWAQEEKLLASDGTDYDYFGISVSIRGNVIVAGAWGDDNSKGDNAGRFCSTCWMVCSVQLIDLTDRWRVCFFNPVKADWDAHDGANRPAIGPSFSATIASCISAAIRRTHGGSERRAVVHPFGGPNYRAIQHAEYAPNL